LSFTRHFFSGCLLEKVALSLKDAYPSLTPEDQFRAAQKLVLTLSTMLASPATENRIAIIQINLSKIGK
jgi:hypothetical protein